MPRPLLLLLGDSTTEFGSDPTMDGWVCRLLNRYSRVADIAQRGMGGYSTEWFMNLVVGPLETDLSTTLCPALITLWLGANDAALMDGPSGNQHVPLATYKSNLHVMVAMFQRKAPQAKIMLITPPAVDDTARRLANNGVLDRSNSAAGEYARVCVQVAQEAGVASLDLHSLFNAFPKTTWTSFLVDGLHLSPSGNRFVESQLAATITTEFPDLQQQLQRLEFPMYLQNSAVSLRGWRQVEVGASTERFKLTSSTGLPLHSSRGDRVALLASGGLVVALILVVRRSFQRFRRRGSVQIQRLKIPRMPRPLLLFLGDSITEFGSNWTDDGWICLLTHRYNRVADIAQRGMGGYNTQMFLDVVMTAVVIDLVTTLRPVLITLWLGANDAALVDGPAAAQNVPLEQFKSNLHTMIEMFQEHAPHAKILLITPPTVDDERRRGPDGRLDRSNAAAAAYARGCVDVAQWAGVVVLDLFSVFHAQPKHVWTALLSDGLHLSPRGNHVVEQYVAHTIQRQFPEIQQQLDSWEFPPFQDLMDVDPNTGTCPLPIAPRMSGLVGGLTSWLRQLVPA